MPIASLCLDSAVQVTQDSFDSGQVRLLPGGNDKTYENKKQLKGRQKKSLPNFVCQNIWCEFETNWSSVGLFITVQLRQNLAFVLVFFCVLVCFGRVMLNENRGTRRIHYRTNPCYNVGSLLYLMC